MPRLFATAVAATKKIVAACALTMGLAILAGCPAPPLLDEGPTASFEVSKRFGKAPLTVDFRNTSQPFQSPIVAWQWSFGDGTTSNKANPTHTYFQPGSYTVSFTVTSPDGRATIRRENFIVVSQSSAFAELGPQGGEGILEGLRFSLPAGALEDPLVIGVQKGADDFIRNTDESITTLSEVFTITHNGAGTRVHAITGELGQTEAATISFPIFSDIVPAADLSPAKIMVLAKLPDERIVPIPAEVQEDQVTIRVNELPKQADYIVVYRPAAQLTAVQVEIAFKQDFEFGWPKQWNISYSPALLQQLTALRAGSAANPGPFSRRNFTQRDLDQTLQELRGNIERIQEILEGSGLLIPNLAPANGGLNLLFYNMGLNYSPDQAFENVLWADRSFGHLVIDPRALLAVSQGNANAAATNPDRAQKFSVRNAFTQEIYRAAFKSYQMPMITTTSPADNRQVAVWEGLREGGAIYLGQLLDNQPFNRSFTPGEAIDLSVPAFQPFASGVRGYAAASQDVLRFLQRDVVGGNSLGFLLDLTGDTAGILVEVKKRLQTIADSGFSFNFTQALQQMTEAIDEAVVEASGVSLGTAYASLATSLAVDQTPGDAFRPSQAALDPFTLDHDRLAESAKTKRDFEAPTDIEEISANSLSVLRDIPPLSTRAIRLGVFPLSSEVTLSFNRDEWLEDDAGNSVAVTIYQQGRTGMVLPDDADSIVLTDFVEDPENCLDEVIILVSNTTLDQSQSVAVMAEAFAGQPIPSGEVLDAYLAACDPNYSWTIQSSSVIPSIGARTTVLEIQSGAWRGSEEVNQPVWRHFATIVEPPAAANNTALLFVSGGSTGNMSSTALNVLAPFVAASGSVGVFLQAVPNQPLIFEGEDRTRSEDAIIAYSYDQYMNGFNADDPDMTWPALLPMTRAAVRTMDAVQEYLATNPNSNASVSNFVVGGASKRGWTTWLTSAADARVSGAIPLVIDVLNMEVQIDHHERSLCGFSPALNDYVELGIFDRFGTPASAALLGIVDPYSYLDRLTMPKLIINSTGDQFFVPDSAQFYYHDLPGEKRLYYAPNSDHGLGGSSGALAISESVLDVMLAWYQAFTRSLTRPSIQWSFEAENRVRVTTLREPSQVVLWQANNPAERDFRLDVIGAAWESTILEAEEDGSFVGEIEMPESGWSGFYVEVTWPGPSPTADYVFTTEVRIVPDTFPMCEVEEAR